MSGWNSLPSYIACRVVASLHCSRVAPPSEERMRELDEEKEMLRNMRRHKRKLFLLQRQAVSCHQLVHYCSYL